MKKGFVLLLSILFISAPLWALAVETQRPKPIVRDPHAVRMMRDINYDFSRFSRAWLSQVGVAIRTMLLDRAVEGLITGSSTSDSCRRVATHLDSAAHFT